MCAYSCLLKIHFFSHLQPNGGEKYGLTGWRNGRRWGGLLQLAQRERTPRVREEEGFDTGRIRLVLGELQAFHIRGSQEEIFAFPHERSTSERIDLFIEGFHVGYFWFSFLLYTNTSTRDKNLHCNCGYQLLLPYVVGNSMLPK